MEEEIQSKQSKIIPFHQELSVILGSKESFKCKKGNLAHLICSQPKCQSPGLMCRVEDCQCQQLHFRCKPVFLKRVIQSVLKKSKDIPQYVKQSYKTIYQKINQMIDDLSDLKSKFQSEQEYFAFMKQQFRFVELVIDNKMSEINGKIISGMQHTLDSEIEFAIRSKQDILKDFQSKRRQFDKLCEDIQKSYRKKDTSSKYNIFVDSKIVFENQDRYLLKQWLCEGKQDIFNPIQSKLLFRASQHQFKKDKFKQICSNIPDTIIIVRNQYDKIIGGFTRQKWVNSTANNYDKYVKDESGKSFLFSLSLKEKYKCIQPEKSIRNHYYLGPAFGSQGDLYIYDDAHTSTSNYAAFPTSYNCLMNNKKKYQKNQQTYTLFTGNQNGSTFRVKQYEIYQILGLSQQLTQF